MIKKFIFKAVYKNNVSVDLQAIAEAKKADEITNIFEQNVPETVENLGVTEQNEIEENIEQLEEEVDTSKQEEIEQQSEEPEFQMDDIDEMLDDLKKKKSLF